MRRTALAAIVVLVILSSLLSGCGERETPTQNIIKIGVNLDFTGSASAQCIGAEHSYQMAIDAINEAGGVRVKGKSYIMQMKTYQTSFTNAEAAAACVRRMVLQDGLRILFDSTFPGALDTVYPDIIENKVLMFNTFVDESVVVPEHPYSFRCCLGYKDNQLVQWKQVIPELFPGLKKYAFIGYKGQPSNAKYSQLYSASMNIECLAAETYAYGTTDFSPIITKVLQLEPELIEVGGYAADLANLIKQLRQQGYTGAIVGSSTIEPAVLMSIAGPEAAEGVYIGSNQAAPTGPFATPAMTEFYDEYVDKYGKDAWMGLNSNWYSVPYILKQAIEQADSLETDDIVQALETGEFSILRSETKVTFGGAETYGIKHQLQVPFFESQIQNGQLVNLVSVPSVIP
ncbi:MAG: ABC transporter substrate-binding protein [Dehalococcoidia bacterium]|nr:ABC transporter substrate-binding protein [Dehalococcoidia bacterium]